MKKVLWCAAKSDKKTGCSSPRFCIRPEDLALSLPRVPEARWRVGFVHDLHLGGHGAILTRANFQHRNRVAHTDKNWGLISPADRLDANLICNTPCEGLFVSLFGKSLFGEVLTGGDTQIPFGRSFAPLVPDRQNLRNGVGRAVRSLPCSRHDQPAGPSASNSRQKEGRP